MACVSKAIAALMLVVVGWPHDGAAPHASEDGFHLAVPSGTEHAAVGGRTFGIGERVSLDPSSASLFSVSNRNERFHLSVSVPRDSAGATPPWRVLVVGARSFLQTSGGASADTAMLGFDIRGRENAEAVARFLSIEPALRAHPGHALDIVFEPKLPVNARGKPVEVVMRITNVGDAPFAFRQGGMNRGARDNQYAFSARCGGRHVPDVGDAMHFGGLAAKRTLPPGATLESVVDLRDWFAFDAPGTYEILGSWFMAFEDPDSTASRTIWESWATAGFTVTITGD